MFSQTIFGAALPTWALFAEITLAGCLVILLGSRLTRLADKLGDEFNLGKAWVGMLLLATVTSLPEVVTGGTAVAIGNPDLAFAAIFGSCSLNIILVVMINGVMGGGSILSRATGSHMLTTAAGIILLALALLGITLVDKFADRPGLAQGCELVIAASITVSYCYFVRMTYRYDHPEREVPELETPAKPRTPGLGTRIAVIAAALVAAAWWLTKTGDILADHHIELIGRPLGDSFVGLAFLALATSLPEVVTCLAAVRMGQLDLALGNIFGSNMFNILVIPLLKVISFVRGDALLMNGQEFHPQPNIIAGLLPILLTGITVMGLTYRSERRAWRFGIDSVLLALVYIAGMYLVFIDAS
ncbi:MAG: sodium:calcium antiporter [Planctomycetota bacterium]